MEPEDLNKTLFLEREDSSKIEKTVEKVNHMLKTASNKKASLNFGIKRGRYSPYSTRKYYNIVGKKKALAHFRKTTTRSLIERQKSALIKNSCNKKEILKTSEDLDLEDGISSKFQTRNVFDHSTTDMIEEDLTNTTQNNKKTNEVHAAIDNSSRMEDSVEIDSNSNSQSFIPESADEPVESQPPLMMHNRLESLGSTSSNETLQSLPSHLTPGAPTDEDEKKKYKIFEGVTAVMNQKLLHNPRISEFMVKKLPSKFGVATIMLPGNIMALHGSWRDVRKAREHLAKLSESLMKWQTSNQSIKITPHYSSAASKNKNSNSEDCIEECSPHFTTGRSGKKFNYFVFEDEMDKQNDKCTTISHHHSNNDGYGVRKDQSQKSVSTKQSINALSDVDEAHFSIHLDDLIPENGELCQKSSVSPETSQSLKKSVQLSKNFALSDKSKNLVGDDDAQFSFSSLPSENSSGTNVSQQQCKYGRSACRILNKPQTCDQSRQESICHDLVIDYNFLHCSCLEKDPFVNSHGTHVCSSRAPDKEMDFQFPEHTNSSFCTKHCVVLQDSQQACKLCGKLFCRASALIDHMKYHGKQTTECSGCFSSKHNLDDTAREPTSNFNAFSKAAQVKAQLDNKSNFIDDIHTETFSTQNCLTYEEHDVTEMSTIDYSTNYKEYANAKKSDGSKKRCRVKKQRFTKKKRHAANKCMLDAGISTRPYNTRSNIAEQLKLVVLRKDESFKCTLCKEGYTSENHLRKYLNQYDNKSNLCRICRVCAKVYSTQNRLNKHLEVHTVKSVSSLQCEKVHTKNMKKMNDNRKRGAMKCSVTRNSYEARKCVDNNMQVHTMSSRSRIKEEQYSSSLCVTKHLQLHALEHSLVCEFCEKTFRSTILFTKHMKHHYVESKSLVCKICKKRFASVVAFKKHRKVHAIETTSLECRICEKTFASSGRLSNHLRRHNLRKVHAIEPTSLQCRICEKTFTSSGRLRNHLRRHDLRKVQAIKTTSLQCRICEKTFSSSGRLSNHFKRHCLREETLVCKICEKTFTSGIRLHKHIQAHALTKEKRHCKDSNGSLDVCFDKHHLKIPLKKQKSLVSQEVFVPHCLKEQSECITLKPPFLCQECGREFVSSAYLERHLKVHAAKTLLACQKCGKELKSKKLLRKHLKSHDSKWRSFNCGTCGKSCISKLCLSKHKKIHSSKKILTCDKCEKKFKTLLRFNRHMKQHEKETLMCDKCRKVFMTSSSLAKHLELHAKKKEVFTCGICGKKFRTSFLLTRHLKTHAKTGKPSLSGSYDNLSTLSARKKRTSFRCNKCGKYFYSHVHFISHLKFHITEKRSHFCKLCERKFAYVNRYINHLMNHAAKMNSLTCLMCEKTFVSMSRLGHHLKRHARKMKSLVCGICLKHFSSTNRILVHMNVHINDSDIK